MPLGQGRRSCTWVSSTMRTRELKIPAKRPGGTDKIELDRTPEAAGPACSLSVGILGSPNRSQRHLARTPENVTGNLGDSSEMSGIGRGVVHTWTRARIGLDTQLLRSSETGPGLSRTGQGEAKGDQMLGGSSDRLSNQSLQQLRR